MHLIEIIEAKWLSKSDLLKNYSGFLMFCKNESSLKLRFATTVKNDISDGSEKFKIELLLKPVLKDFQFSNLRKHK